jgi:hypothetical protein
MNIAPPAPATTGLLRAYCKHCGYPLHGLINNQCPECGRQFDPSDSATFARRPPRLALRRSLRRCATSLLLLLLGAACAFAWLWWDWRGEQKAIVRIQEGYAQIKTRPIGPERLRLLCPPRWAYLFDRVDDVHYRERSTESWETSPPPIDWTRLRHLRSVELNWSRVTTDDLHRLRQLKHLKAVYLQHATLDDALPAGLAELPSLETLDLAYTCVTDNDLAAWRGNRRLRVLRLWHTSISDVGLAHLSHVPALEVLDLSDTRITDAGLPHLYGLASLQEIDLRGTSVTPEGLRQLRNACPHATIKSDQPLTSTPHP